MNFLPIAKTSTLRKNNYGLKERLTGTVRPTWGMVKVGRGVPTEPSEYQSGAAHRDGSPYLEFKQAARMPSIIMHYELSEAPHTSYMSHTSHPSGDEISFSSFDLTQVRGIK